MDFICTRSVWVLNEIKLRTLFIVKSRHTRSRAHFIMSVCLSLFSLLAQANIFVFILQGNCFSSADLACEKERSENGNWLYCFYVKSFRWKTNEWEWRKVEFGMEWWKGEGKRKRNKWSNSMGMRDNRRIREVYRVRKKIGWARQKDNNGVIEGGEDSSGCWGMKKTQRSSKMERRRQRGREEKGVVMCNSVHVHWSGVFNLTRWTSCPERCFFSSLPLWWGWSVVPFSPPRSGRDVSLR